MKRDKSTGKEEAVPWAAASWVLRASREASGIAVMQETCK
jgi:hypothetical protein